MVMFPSVRLGEKDVRFVYLRRPGSFYATERGREEDIPLFLGADVLSGSNILTKNHGRIHARFSKDKCATKVTMKGVTIEGINHSSKLWFYNVQGLFKVTFEYLNTIAQCDCLRHLRDLWLETRSHSELPHEMSLTYSVVDLPKQSAQLHGLTETHQETPPVSETHQGASVVSDTHDDVQLLIEMHKRGPPNSNNLQHNVLAPGENLVELTMDDINNRITVAGSDSVDVLEFSVMEQPDNTPGYGSAAFLDRLIAPGVLDIEVNMAKETQGEDDALNSVEVTTGPILNLDQICRSVVAFVNESEQKVSEVELALLKKLKILLHFFKVEYLDSDPETAAFPIILLDQYATLLASESKQKHFQDTFDTAPNAKIALCVVCEWLGKELHGFSEAISEKVETFKVQHIHPINSLPPPQSLVDSLFPACMRILMVNWMGQEGMGYGDEMTKDLPSDDDKNPPCKKPTHKQASNKQFANTFPFIQLILEFANNVLISGVAHVLYARFLHDKSC